MWQVAAELHRSDDESPARPRAAWRCRLAGGELLDPLPHRSKVTRYRLEAARWRLIVAANQNPRYSPNLALKIVGIP